MLAEEKKEILISEKDVEQVLEDLEQMQIALSRLVLKVNGVLKRGKINQNNAFGFGKDHVMTVSEASDFLNVHPDTIRRWVDKGQIHSIRHPVNGYRLVSKKSLDELKEEFHEKLLV